MPMIDLKKPLRLAKRSFRTFKKRFQPVAIILMYHRISEVALEPNWLTVSPNNFAQHLEQIRCEYHPVRLLDLVDAIESKSIPNRAVVVTFDDGYRDNFMVALPLLETAQIPATVFTTAGYIDSMKEFWWDELQRLILTPPHVKPTLSLQIQERYYNWQTASKDDRKEAYLSLKEIIKPLPSSIQEDVLSNLARWSGLRRVLRDDYRTMTASELKKLAQSEYVDIGAHTMSHPILPTLSPDEQYDEIINSKSHLETILNQPVSTFAYPNGDFTDLTVKIVKEAGFRTACTTREGCVKSGDDLFRLRRCSVNDWDIETFNHALEAYYYMDN